MRYHFSHLRCAGAAFAPFLIAPHRKTRTTLKRTLVWRTSEVQITLLRTNHEQQQLF
jgi:hypothetical protein